MWVGRERNEATDAGGRGGIVVEVVYVVGKAEQA